MDSSQQVLQTNEKLFSNFKLGFACEPEFIFLLACTTGRVQAQSKE